MKTKYARQFSEVYKDSISKFYALFRMQVKSSLQEIDTKIGGEGIIVQIYESKFGKRKYHRGHHVEGVWVLEELKKHMKKSVS